MDQSTALQQILQEHLLWNKARVNFAARFVIALIKMCSVNFTQIALALNSNVATSSNYRRLQRFFNGFTFDQLSLTRLLLALLPQREHLILTMDRTMWRFGARYHNMLVIAACGEGIAIPLLWRMLPKEGCTNTQMRIDLLEELFCVLDPKQVRCLVGDREFIGARWFGYLKERNLPFVMRIRAHFYVSTRKGSRVRARRIVAHLRPGEALMLRKRRRICTHSLFLCAIAPKKGEDVVILAGTEIAHRAFAFYRHRWQIETLFAATKSRGFDLESTHLFDKERVAKLFGLLSIAFVWAYRVGLWAHEHLKAIAYKSHGRRAKSVFRYGLDLIRVLLLNQTTCDSRFLKYSQILSCT